MKTFVITLSKTFPRTHIHSGRETNFAHLLGNGLNLTEDGLSFSDWYDWFRKVDLRQPMAIIHFTKFRYGKTSDSRRSEKFSLGF